MIDLATVKTVVASAVADADPGELAELAGVLEQGRVLLAQRIATPPPAPSPTTPALATAEDLARRFSMPASWFYEAARLGRLPHQRLGRYVRFDVDAVETALGAGCKTVSLVHTPKKRSKNGDKNGRPGARVATMSPAVSSGVPRG